MKANDLPEFLKVWNQTCEVYGKPASPDAKEMIFKLLAPYSIEAIRAALQAHMSDPVEGKWMPKPADVIAKIEAVATDGFIGAEEAWALFPHDESQTAFVTQEASEAYGATVGLDKISARMTFKEKYVRLIAKAKAENRKPVCRISPGTDNQQRTEATLTAVEQGLISSSYAIALLPHIEENEILAIENKSASPQAVIGRSEQKLIGLDEVAKMAVEKAAPEVAKTHLDEINKLLGIERKVVA